MGRVLSRQGQALVTGSGPIKDKRKEELAKAVNTRHTAQDRGFHNEGLMRYGHHGWGHELEICHPDSPHDNLEDYERPRGSPRRFLMNSGERS